MVHHLPLDSFFEAGHLRSRPEPILPKNDSTILLAVYENPDMSDDSFHFTDMLYFPGMTKPRT